MTTTIRSRKTRNKNPHRSKIRTDPDKDNNNSLEAKLEDEYIVRRFYDSGTVALNWCLVFIGCCVLLYGYPGMRYLCTVGIIDRVIHYVLRRHTNLYEGTEHEEQAMNVYRDANVVCGLLRAVMVWSDDSISSEEGRNAHVSMIVLLLCFLGTLVVRIHAPRCHKHYPCIPLVVFPLLSLHKPRFGIMEPRYEAIAFFVAFGLAELLGAIIDEMQWRHFVSIERKNRVIREKTRELSVEIRNRTMAMEALASYRDESMFEIIR